MSIWKKLTEWQTSLQHSTNPVFIAVWQDSILSSVKSHENPLGLCNKAKNSQIVRSKILWCWASIPSIMFEGNQTRHCSCPAQSHSNSKVRWLHPHSSCCVLATGTEGLIRVESKWKPSPEHSEPQTGQKNHPPTAQWLEAHSKCGLYNSVNVLEWSEPQLEIKHFWRNLKMSASPHPRWQS